MLEHNSYIELISIGYFDSDGSLLNWNNPKLPNISDVIDGYADEPSHMYFQGKRVSYHSNPKKCCYTCILKRVKFVVKNESTCKDDNHKMTLLGTKWVCKNKGCDHFFY